MNKTHTDTATRSGIDPVWLCWFNCLGCLAAYFWAFDDRLTASFVATVGVTGMAGYWLGGAVIVGFLLGVGSASLFADKLAHAFGPAVSDFLGTFGPFNEILAASLGVITVGFVSMLFVEIVWNRLLGGREKIRQYNHSLGLTFGAIQGGVLSLFLLGAAHVAAPYAAQASVGHVKNVRSFDEFVRHCVATTAIDVDRAMTGSSIEALVEKHTPFHRLPSMRSLYSARETPEFATSLPTR